MPTQSHYTVKMMNKSKITKSITVKTSNSNDIKMTIVTRSCFARRNAGGEPLKLVEVTTHHK